MRNIIYPNASNGNLREQIVLTHLHMMTQPTTKWHQFYVKGEYKGFRKLNEQVYKLSGTTRMTFSNGDKQVYAAGNFKEEALEKIFRQIDRYYSNN